MESVVEFLAVIHRVLGSITSLWGGGNGKGWNGRRKRQTVHEKMLQAMAIVSATWEAEPGGLLQLMNLRPN